MKAQDVTNIILGVLAFVVVAATFFVSVRANRKQSEATTATVDAEAYTRARGLYESMLTAMRNESASMRTEMDRLQRSNNELRDSNDRLAQQEAELRDEVTKLRSEMASLRRYIAELEGRKGGASG